MGNSSSGSIMQAWDELSLSIFGKKLKEGRWHEEAISYRSDAADWLCLG